MAACLVLCACTGPSAAAATLPAEFLASSPAAASPETATYAVSDAFGRLKLLTPGRPDQVPDLLNSPCAPQAIARGVVYGCAQADGTFVAVPFPSGLPSVVRPSRISPASSTERFVPGTRAGTAWLGGTVVLRSDLGGTELRVPAVVRRRDGMTVDARGLLAGDVRSWGPRAFLDLSADGLHGRLCSPLRREPLVTGPAGAYDDLVRVGRWTMRAAGSGTGAARWVVQRCGARRRALTLAAGATPVLGDGWVAWIDRRQVRLRRLSTGRTTSCRWSGSRPRIALSANRLIVSQPVPGGWRVRVLRLRQGAPAAGG
ncbi:hypothetical protein [Conexibacter sp. SYSU D00693]|uniref:hypothetical protein n=1 Tax=Conexibacter sp. SYSU D00693 TaxID=2812560 RepID=UPI00196B60EA|nr:hypothetical protein [Conexibacter sp. SYSU D00693]